VGAQSDQSSFHLDRGNNSDDMAATYNSYTISNGGGTLGVAPTPVESIEEFQVGVSNQTADFNGARGAQRVNNGIEGDARRSTPEIGRKISDMKVDYALAQIQQLLK
ncbi:MAG TPA: hypothetical protein VGM43_10770, partial [Bryobacteraceae bacterium]